MTGGSGGAACMTSYVPTIHDMIMLGSYSQSKVNKKRMQTVNVPHTDTKQVEERRELEGGICVRGSPDPQRDYICHRRYNLIELGWRL